MKTIAAILIFYKRGEKPAAGGKACRFFIYLLKLTGNMVTASQTLKIYELLNKHFKNEEDAKRLVQEIEQVIDVKFDSAKDRLATKEDLSKLEIRIEQGFKDQLKWLIVLMLGFSSLIIALIKLT